jgi:hypothetical protein
LDDALLRVLQKRAAQEGRPLQEVMGDLIRRGLAETGRRRYRLKLQGWKAREQPGVDILDRDKLFDLMNGR